MSKPSSKAALVKVCREQGIPVPLDATTKSLRHRIRYWWEGKGWLFRLVRPASRKMNHPVQFLEEWDKVYWVPNSRMAKMIAESKLVFILGREHESPKDAIILQIPEGFSKKWPIGDKHGNIRDDN